MYDVKRRTGYRTAILYSTVHGMPVWLYCDIAVYTACPRGTSLYMNMRTHASMASYRLQLYSDRVKWQCGAGGCAVVASLTWHSATKASPQRHMPAHARYKLCSVSSSAC